MGEVNRNSPNTIVSFINEFVDIKIRSPAKTLASPVLRVEARVFFSFLGFLLPAALELFFKFSHPGVVRGLFCVDVAFEGVQPVLRFFRCFYRGAEVGLRFYGHEDLLGFSDAGAEPAEHVGDVVASGAFLG